MIISTTTQKRIEYSQKEKIDEIYFSYSDPYRKKFLKIPHSALGSVGFWEIAELMNNISPMNMLTSDLRRIAFSLCSQFSKYHAAILFEAWTRGRIKNVTTWELIKEFNPRKTRGITIKSLFALVKKKD